jgi:hypothetical protein
VIVQIDAPVREGGEAVVGICIDVGGTVVEGIERDIQVIRVAGAVRRHIDGLAVAGIEADVVVKLAALDAQIVAVAVNPYCTGIRSAGIELQALQIDVGCVVDLEYIVLCGTGIGVREPYISFIQRIDAQRVLIVLYIDFKGAFMGTAGEKKSGGASRPSVLAASKAALRVGK